LKLKIEINKTHIKRYFMVYAMEYTVTMRMTIEQLEALRNSFESGQVIYQEFSYEEFIDDGESIDEDSEVEEDSEDEEPNTSDDEFIDDSDIY
jgi:hypothetical protein